MVVAAAATMALSGCAGLNPGAAAVVGSETISRDQVDDVALALCSANIASAKVSNQPAPTLASRGARELALQIMLETELSQQFGEAEGFEASKQQVSAAVAQNENGILMLPKSRQEDFRHALSSYAEGQLILIEAGRDALGAEATDDEAIAEGQKLRAAYVEDLDVEVDPRYGTFEEGAFVRGGSSLSVPVSDAAVAGDADQPDEGFVAALPASQKCS